MNILVIGNGFDLAHGLPTKYKDFLIFTKAAITYSQDKASKLSDTDEKCKRGVKDFVNKKEESLVKELVGLDSNKWYNYFKESDKEDKGWIDFESSIAHVIQAMDRMRKAIKSQKEQASKDIEILKGVMGKTPDSYYTKEEWLAECKSILIDDLNKLIRGLEIYLAEYVDDIKISSILPDLKNMDCVLSFNYTNTYKKMYDNNEETKKRIQYDYIHGKINKESDKTRCNLVLGIDEYLDGEERRTDNEYIQFKKFYQRIIKRTGCKYINWIEDVRKSALEEEKGEQNKVYILGHSLDVTDGDIIANLINMPNTQTIIYHHNQEAFEKQVCNLVKILGENELIAKVYGHNASIIFEKQKDPKIMS